MATNVVCETERNVFRSKQSNKRKEYLETREYLQTQGCLLPQEAHLAAWNSYEKAYESLCLEFMRMGEIEKLKNRRCGSEEVDVMRSHILLRSKYQPKTGAKFVTDLNSLATEIRSWPKSHAGFESEHPKTKLSTYSTIVNTELNRWSSHMEKRTVIEELKDLVNIDSMMEHIENDMMQLFLDHPEESLEILEKKMELVKIMRKKWKICNEEVLNQLKRPDLYKAFKDNWECHFKTALPLHHDRELLLLKQLLHDAKPELDVAPSVEKIWKVLDSACGRQARSIKPRQETADLIQAANPKSEDCRDLEKLLEFIEGEDGKEKKDQSEKKKKRNKKQIATERNASGEKPKSELKQSTSTKEEDLGLDEKEKIKKKRAGKEKVESMKEKANSMKEKVDSMNGKVNIMNEKVDSMKGKVDSTKGKHSEEKEVTCGKEDSAETMEAQIEGKEILIQQRRDFLEQIVEVHGKEMAKVITDIEAAEDEKNEKLKEKSAVEMQISDLKIKHKRLEREVKEKDKTMINLARKKRDLETYIENNVVSTKKEIALLEEDIKSLKTYRPPQPSTEARNDGSIARGQLNLQLIEFIESKIEAKEEELACPVCLEVASPPIFTCSDLHLICSDCKPKVTPFKCHLNWVQTFILDKNTSHFRCPSALSVENLTRRKRNDTDTPKRRPKN